MPKPNGIFGIAYQLVLASTLLCLPMFIFGLDGPDYPNHLRWSGEFDRLLHTGIWYPRWLPDTNYGYGNPTFIFYGPVLYYAVALVHLFIPSIPIALKMTCWLGFVFSGITMYLFAREFCDHRTSSWSALAYILLPYHAMDLYSRSALSEFWAFVWAPLVCLFAWRLWQGRSHALVGLAGSYTALIMTNLSAAFLTGLALVAYVAYLAVVDTRDRPVKLLRLVLGGGMGLCLSALYLIPALFEQFYVQIHLVTDLPHGNVLNNFLFAHPWYALGFSIEVSLGAMVTLAVLLGSLYVLGVGGGQATFWAILGLWTILLTTEVSRPFWQVVPVLPTIQFPWRWLFITSFAASFALAVALSALYRSDPESLRLRQKPFLVLTLLLVLGPGLLWLHDFLRYDEIPRPPNPFPTLSQVQKNMTISELYRVLPAIYQDHGWDVPEFRPVWAPLALATIAPPVSWARGSGTAKIEQWDPLQRRIRVEAWEPGTLKLRTFYYPGWIARINGKPAAIRPDPGDGSMTVAVTPGIHQVQTNLESTTTQQMGKIISGIALLVLGAASGYELWRSRWKTPGLSRP